MWKRLAVMSLLMVTVGCKPSVDKAGPAANAETAASTASAETPSLRFLPELAKGIAAMPRVTGETPEIRAINADLERMDGQVRAALPDCSAGGVEHTYWERFVDAPMMGPRFITVTVSDDLYCGGTHPDTARMTVSYDLLTGKRIDWTGLLPPTLFQPLQKTTSAFDFDFTVSRSPRLLSWLRDKIVRDLKAEDQAWWEDCKTSYSDADVPALAISIDAKHEGLSIQTISLPHVIQACTSTEVMSVAELQAMGASPDLIAAIQTAHRERNWRADLGSRTP